MESVETMLFILMSFVLFVGIVKLMRYPYGGSDHCYHYRLTQYNKQSPNLLASHFERYYQHFYVCPQLYHYLCSKLPNSFLLEKANWVNYIISFVMIVVFNGVVAVLRETFMWGFWDVLLLNMLFVTMPIFYAVWNAKFMGLSARAFGLLLAHIYLYILLAYLESPTLLLWLLLCVVAYVIILSSQFAMQFLIFSSLFVACASGHFELLLLFPLCACLTFVFHFSFAKGFWHAQYHHKRNYSKFLIHDCHFKARYSIWRDFVKDFWSKDKSYFLNNPVIEVLIGALPCCLVMVAVPFMNTGDVFYSHVYLLLCACFFAFWITSLRIGRFLGEAQRYIEFGIPFACILALLNLNIWVIVGLIVFNLLVLLWYSKNSQHHRQLPEHIKIREEMIAYLKREYKETLKHLFSNDSEIARYFYTTSYEPHVPNHCMYYKDKAAFLFNFYKGDYHRISPEFLSREMNSVGQGILILYTNLLKFYDASTLEPLLGEIKLVHKKDIGKFKIFEFYKESA